MVTFLYLIDIALSILMIIALWKLYERAGYPGWTSIIPIYNIYIMLKIAGKPGWWWLLFLIPVVNIVIGIIVTIEFAKHYGKDTGFALGMVFLCFIFYPILAFSDAQYTA